MYVAHPSSDVDPHAPGRGVPAATHRLTDQERDTIDTQAQLFMHQCLATLRDLAQRVRHPCDDDGLARAPAAQRTCTFGASVSSPWPHPTAPVGSLASPS